MNALETIRRRVLEENDECRTSEEFDFNGRTEYGACGDCSWCLAVGLARGTHVDEWGAAYDAAITPFTAFSPSPTEEGSK